MFYLRVIENVERKLNDDAHKCSALPNRNFDQIGFIGCSAHKLRYFSLNFMYLLNVCNLLGLFVCRYCCCCNAIMPFNVSFQIG